MAGLLSDVLPWIYSTGNTVRKNVRGLLNDPAAFGQSLVQDLQAQNQQRSQDYGMLFQPGVFTSPQERQQAMTRAAQEAINYAAPIVYHGSPHKFDKFDSSKIGTGEGAQAYGHGLYLAENPAVAKEYAKVDPSVMPSPVRVFKGQELTPGTPEYHAGTLLERASLAQARKEVAGWIKEGSPDPRLVEGWKKTLDTLNQATSKADFKVAPNSHIYKVDLPDTAVAKMLDWDKPLSQQAPEVQKAIKAMPISNSGAALLEKDPTGEQIYRMIEDYGNQTHRIAEKMGGLGIPGIRYLDQGSRGAAQIGDVVGKRESELLDAILKAKSAGNSRLVAQLTSELENLKPASKPTYNYVVFPGGEGLLNILERNGQPIGLLGR